MHNGEGQAGPSSSSAPEIVVEAVPAGGATQVVTTAVDSAVQEEKNRVSAGVERVMDTFRKGECTRFQASSQIISELDKWAGVSDGEREKTFNSYLAEINSHVEPRGEDRSATQETTAPPGAAHLAGPSLKRPRDEVEDFLDRISRGEPVDDDDGEQRVVRRRAREDEMPWFDPATSSS